MAEYFGDEAAIARQKRLQERQPMLANMPLLASASRLLLLIDTVPEAWAAAREWIEEDGIVAVLAGSEEVFRKRTVEELGAHWDTHVWRVYSGSAKTIHAATKCVVADTPLPAGWSVRFEESPSDADIEAFQGLNAAVGVSPSPAAAMRSSPERPAMSVFITNEKQRLMVVAWAGMFFHPQSSHAQAAFIGLVSVDAQARGLGLGKLANALVAAESQTRMGWTEALEFVHADNPASIAMVTASGLTWNGSDVAGIASRDMGRFTR